MIRFRFSNQPVFDSLYEELSAAASDEAVDTSLKRTRSAQVDAALSAVLESTNPPPASPNPHIYAEAETDIEHAAPPSTNPDDIRQELALDNHMTLERLAQLRREFALRNHPDKFPLEIQPLATERMMIANALLDAEQRKILERQN